jgi:cellobiose-specific phosphotransferase system component IIC
LKIPHYFPSEVIAEFSMERPLFGILCSMWMIHIISEIWTSRECISFWKTCVFQYKRRLLKFALKLGIFIWMVLCWKRWLSSAWFQNWRFFWW